MYVVILSFGGCIFNVCNAYLLLRKQSGITNKTRDENIIISGLFLI